MTHKITTLLVLSVLITIAAASQNLYSLLQISQDASSDQIKKAFRRLSVKYHPDRNSDNQQIQKHYLEIQRAFEILIDVSKRNIYDLWGEEGLKKLNEQPKRKGGDYRPEMPIPLQLFYTGGQEVFNFRRGQICKKCKGTGDQSGAVKTCPICSGSGKMRRQVRVFQKFKSVEMKCKECKGIGIGSTSKCPVCKGQKILLRPRDLKFTIQKGMNDGDKVVFKGQSEQGFEFYPGDVVLTLRQMGHHLFKRDGNDLKMDMKISLKEAILGFEKTIKHLDGRNLQISSDYNVQNGEEIRLKGEGMPIRGQIDQFGDLIVKVTIDFPKNYSEQQIQQIKEICNRSEEGEL